MYPLPVQQVSISSATPPPASWDQGTSHEHLSRDPSKPERCRCDVGLLVQSTPANFYNLELSKLEGCCSAHPRRARANRQLGVERQYRRSVSCNVTSIT